MLLLKLWYYLVRKYNVRELTVFGKAKPRLRDHFRLLLFRHTLLRNTQNYYSTDLSITIR